MSEKLSSERDAKDGIDSKLPQIITRYVDTPKERQLDSLCGSPIVFSNSLRSMYGRDECQGHTRSVEDSCLEKIDPRQNGTKPSKLEWVEQYEPGVYITFITLASGQRGLKRVRFRYFSTDYDLFTWTQLYLKGCLAIHFPIINEHNDFVHYTST